MPYIPRRPPTAGPFAPGAFWRMVVAKRGQPPPTVAFRMVTDAGKQWAEFGIMAEGMVVGDGPAGWIRGRWQFTPQASIDLANWAEGSAFTPRPAEPGEGMATTYWARAALSTEDAPRQFFRLKITKP